MATTTQTVPVPNDLQCTLSNTDPGYSGTGTIMFFGNNPPHQAFRIVSDVHNSSPGIIEFGNITLNGNVFNNVFPNSILRWMGQTSDTYVNFKLLFALPIRLSSASKFTDNNTDKQELVYEGPCRIWWQGGSRTFRSPLMRLIRSMFGQSQTEVIPSSAVDISIFVNSITKAIFVVDSAEVVISIKLFPFFKSVGGQADTIPNPFTGSYSGIEIICNTSNPIRKEDPAIFFLQNATLILT